MTTLFISHSSKDKAWAERTHAALAKEGYQSLFLDSHPDDGIHAGAAWEQTLYQRLRQSRGVVVLCSPNWLASPWCVAEAMMARERKRRVFLLATAEVADGRQVKLPDGRDAPQIPDFLKDKQFISLSSVSGRRRRQVSEDQAFQRLLDGLKKEGLNKKNFKLPKRPYPGLKPFTEDDGAVFFGRDEEIDQVIADFTVFRDVDAPWCPEMVALPAGKFLMGSPESEEGRWDYESPQQRVTIGYRFALACYPVTVGQYRKFVDAAGHRHEGGMYVWTGSDWKQDEAQSWRDPGFAQPDRHPVVGVSWRDAIAYSEWLGSETGKPYRLPSEAEWEYACRAGTTTRYAFGDAITPENANYAESKLGKTTEVGAYPPNPWGLYDMHGNVLEWVEDVWHDSYKNAPADGSAWIDGEGKESSRIRVIRGGSWYISPSFLRSANRSRYGPDIRSSNLGFRVAWTLD